MKLFNDGWQFAKGEPVSFTHVKLPHDWLIYDTNNLYESGTGWYRRELDTGFLQEGQKLFIRFDGVYMDSTLYVNGQKVGEWKYGYTAFEFEITSFVTEGKASELLLKVNHQSPNSRWYSGAGIYRDVFLIVKNACHFIPDGIYITTTKDAGGDWQYSVDSEVETGGRPYELRHTLLDADGGITAWDIDNPRLYTLRSELLVDGTVADSVETRFGFRTISFTADKGFFLNGRHVKIKGVCLHHDLGALGAAASKDAIRRQLELLREMGVNALRTAHNPPAKVFMELTDEMGFLVMSEITDVWKRPKTAYDYARFFDEHIDRDVASWIRRDRNHPSVILWSVGNEIHDTQIDVQDGERTLRRLIALVKQHDPGENARATFCSNYMLWENTQKCADVIKLVGYNYADPQTLYTLHHKEHPDWIIYGSETCATVQSRGVYRFPLEQSVLADDDLQCSVLGNSATSWGAKSVEACIQSDLDIPFSLGQFIWSGQDYIGEPTPYHTKSCYFGHIDTAGFAKDSYYLFQAAWTDYKTKPMVHIVPYWDFSPGQLVDVRVYSNAPSAELFLNGKSLGRTKMNNSANYKVRYRPGELRAAAFDEHGTVIAENCRRSFGDAVKLRLEHDVYGELVFVTITALDEQGNTVENANCRVKVTVCGGVLQALDNGDPTDYEQYQSGSRRLFNGRLVAIVHAETGETPNVEAVIDDNDIPVRKIELTVDGYTVNAKIYPQNAVYNELYWRLADAAGIDSPLGSLEIAADGRSAVLVPKGDGNVYVRCAAKNGRGHLSLIAHQMVTITGCGKPFLDPYTFISGGLYNASNTGLTNGNERGVATLRDGESHVGFRDLDFGDYGSDELVLPLFPLSGEPFTFEIWEDMPQENGKHLCDVLYDKGSIWNTYQEIACKLPRRLRGVTTLCLVFRQKVHIKGFRFERLNKAFQRLTAADNDGIYGDTFTINGTAIENIGNNVSVTFNNMDFGTSGTNGIAISWRSDLSKNSIQIIFSGGECEIKKMVELPRSVQYTNSVFMFDECVAGVKTVSLVFLPGCEISLEWVQFLS